MSFVSRLVLVGLSAALYLGSTPATAQQARQVGRVVSYRALDTTDLRLVEQRVLPQALIAGPAAHEDLTDYYAAANPKLRARFEQIKNCYETQENPVCRALTLVAGDAGVGKTFLKKEVFSKRYPADEVFKLDIREQYEAWQQDGTVCLKPDLHCEDVVINKLPASAKSSDEPLLNLLKARDAKFIVIDSIDELHPDEHVPVLRQLEKLALLHNRTFQHIVVFGRPCAFVDYWSRPFERPRELDIQLFQLNPPQIRTTGDLLVSSCNYVNWKFGTRCRHSDGTTAPLTLGEFTKWSRAGFSRTAAFERIQFEPTRELDPRVHDSLVEYSKQHRVVAPLVCNLAGNSILREIVARRVHSGQSYDEQQVMDAFFQAWLERDFQSDNRPSFQHPDHLDLYLQLLEHVAIKYAYDAQLDQRGHFTVAAADRVHLNYRGRQLSFPVQRILDRSGLKHIDPRNAAPRKYRFEPIWMHRYLVQLHNQRVEGMAHSF